MTRVYEWGETRAHTETLRTNNNRLRIYSRAFDGLRFVVFPCFVNGATSYALELQSGSDSGDGVVVDEEEDAGDALCLRACGRGWAEEVTLVVVEVVGGAVGLD